MRYRADARGPARFPGIYKYISLLYPERQTLMDYMPKDSLAHD